MNESMVEKLHYDAPDAQIISFPEQDIVTYSGYIELPVDDWEW